MLTEHMHHFSWSCCWLIEIIDFRLQESLNDHINHFFYCDRFLFFHSVCLPLLNYELCIFLICNVHKEWLAFFY